MTNTTFWEDEPRDWRGRWTAGGHAVGAGEHDDPARLTRRLIAHILPTVAEANRPNVWFGPSVLERHDRIARMNRLFQSWARAGHWPILNLETENEANPKAEADQSELGRNFVIYFL